MPLAFLQRYSIFYILYSYIKFNLICSIFCAFAFYHFLFIFLSEKFCFIYMKEIIKYILFYFKNQCKFWYLLSTIFFVSILIYINFTFSFEKIWIHQEPNPALRLFKFIAMYATVYIGAYIILFLFNKKDSSLQSKKFFLLIVLAILLFSLRAWFLNINISIPDFISLSYHLYAANTVAMLAGFIFIFLPVFAFWFFTSKNKMPLYGFKFKNTVLYPYFTILLLMVPLLVWASYQQSFKQVYPLANHLGINAKMPYYYLATLFYELSYCFDFIITEFFFRGYLILAFAPYIGYKAILPMCVFYASIHFDKPLAECISSFFGGLVLGIISYNSKSIYGGIIVHMGIALTMELFGWYHLL